MPTAHHISFGRVAARHTKAKHLLTFSSVPPSLQRALAERGYLSATPVQAAVLQPDATGRDLVVSAQTGSGKTVAYGLALAATLLAEGERLPRRQEPMALIIAPTRELALQVQRELEWLYAPAGAVIVGCVGGMDPQRERRQLQSGAHIVVGTPGRLRDHLERRALDVSKLLAVVLDEADEMLDLGFREDLEFILQATPAERRTLLFSATLPKAIVALARRYQADALRIETTSGEAGHVDIEYRALRVAGNERVHAIVNILRQVDSPSAIIFCNTRESVRHLHALLCERGFAAVLLSGELSQNERNHALQALRDRRAQVCVATDVAARGLDLPNLGLVIHADLPSDAQVLQHRSGRTGRAGRKGVSALLVPQAAARKTERLLAAANITAHWGLPPRAAEIRALDRERLLADPLLSEDAGEDDLAMARLLLEQRPAEVLAAALVRLYSGAPAGAGGLDGSHGRAARARGTGGEHDPAAGKLRPQRSRPLRRGVVSPQHRPQEERRSQMAAAHAVPARQDHQGGHRCDPHLRPRDEDRDRGRGGRCLRCQLRRAGRGRSAHRAGGGADAGAAGGAAPAPAAQSAGRGALKREPTRSRQPSIRPFHWTTAPRCPNLHPRTGLPPRRANLYTGAVEDRTGMGLAEHGPARERFARASAGDDRNEP